MMNHDARSELRPVAAAVFLAALLGVLAAVPSREEGGSAETAVYAGAPREWSRIFDALNTGRYSAYRLPRETRDPAAFLTAQSLVDRVRFLSPADFDARAEPVVIRGEREWSLMLAGFGHLLDPAAYEELMAALRQTAAESDRWRTKVDPLVLARFQNDLLLAARAVVAFASREDYPHGFSVPGKGSRAESLVRALGDILEKTLLSEEEIARLPETADLDACSGEFRDWERRYVYWSGRETEHEAATLGCFHNEIYVLFPKPVAALFTKDRVDGYIRDGAWPRTDTVFVLLDRLVVLDERRQLRKTPVTVLVRTSRYYPDPERQPAESRFGHFALRYLRRRAAAADWRAHVEWAGPDETGAALINLPNVPGFASPYYEVPLQLSCIQCHRGGPKVPNRMGEHQLIEDPRDFYVGDRPRGGE